MAPNVVLVEKLARDPLIENLKREIQSAFGLDSRQSADYGRIINERHFDRLSVLLNQGRAIFGGKADRASRFIEPTLLTGVSWKDPVLQEEIFGPILPIWW